MERKFSEEALIVNLLFLQEIQANQLAQNVNKEKAKT